jgi:hypothetical protein
MVQNFFWIKDDSPEKKITTTMSHLGVATCTFRVCLDRVKNSVRIEAS